MALLGTRLLVLLLILTVGLPVATVLLWSRLSGPRLTRIGSRVLLLVSCQLAAVMLVGAAMNDYGYFYTSWSDLVRSTVGAGASSPPTLGVTSGVAPAGAVRSDRTAVHVLPDPGWSTPSQWRTRGRVVAVRIDG